MERDPHKGYCIPYGTAAFVMSGRKTGAYEPVVSDDLSRFLPENLKEFDPIVLNNSLARVSGAAGREVHWSPVERGDRRDGRGVRPGGAKVEHWWARRPTSGGGGGEAVSCACSAP